MNKIFIQKWQSPVGEMILGSLADKVCLCDWSNEKRSTMIARRLCNRLDAIYVQESSLTIERMIQELNEYFSGVRKQFDLPIQFAGTDFQLRVWTELMNIPYGTTISYGELARRIGQIKAVRAVAHANSMNPISIIIPCHRVIGSNNKLTGYAGGLAAKQALLTLESTKK